MTWNATQRPRSGHTVANGLTSTAPSCCGIDEIGDTSLLPNDDGRQGGMCVGSNVRDDDIHGDMLDMQSASR